MSEPDPLEIRPPVFVGIARFAASREAQTTFETGPVGGGLAVAVYDCKAKAGGLLHALLPDSRLDAARATEHPGLFLDTGLAALLNALKETGATPENMLVCAVGAAEVMEADAAFDLGGRNSAALEAALAGLRLKLHKSKTGGPSARMVRLNLASGFVRVRFAGGGKEAILCQL